MIHDVETASRFLQLYGAVLLRAYYSLAFESRTGKTYDPLMDLRHLDRRRRQPVLTITSSCAIFATQLPCLLIFHSTTITRHSTLEARFCSLGPRASKTLNVLPVRQLDPLASLLTTCQGPPTALKPQTMLAVTVIVDVAFESSVCLHRSCHADCWTHRCRWESLCCESVVDSSTSCAPLEPSLYWLRCLIGHLNRLRRHHATPVKIKHLASMSKVPMSLVAGARRQSPIYAARLLVLAAFEPGSDDASVGD